jgi:hypothetical protein
MNRLIYRIKKSSHIDFRQRRTCELLLFQIVEESSFELAHDGKKAALLFTSTSTVLY